MTFPSSTCLTHYFTQVFPVFASWISDCMPISRLVSPPVNILTHGLLDHHKATDELFEQWKCLMGEMTIFPADRMCTEALGILTDRSCGKLIMAARLVFLCSFCSARRSGVPPSSIETDVSPFECLGSERNLLSCCRSSLELIFQQKTAFCSLLLRPEWAFA